MKLLFDQNLSHRLVEMLAPLYPDSSHVRSFGLQNADDEVIWELARRQNFTLVSKDSEFHQRMQSEVAPLGSGDEVRRPSLDI